MYLEHKQSICSHVEACHASVNKMLFYCSSPLTRSSKSLMTYTSNYPQIAVSSEKLTLGYFLYASIIQKLLPNVAKKPSAVENATSESNCTKPLTDLGLSDVVNSILGLCFRSKYGAISSLSSSSKTSRSSF